MLRPRIIPCLLVKNGGLVKTVRFAEPRYVGDPLNAVRIFNEKTVDELMVLDIDATRNGRGPDYTLIKNLASECRMPLSYGGGVTTLEQIQKIISLGVEKVALSAAAIMTPGLISAAAQSVGSQSVAVVIDVKWNGASNRYEIFTHNGTKPSGIEAVGFAKAMQERGAGEIVVNSIDRDGTLSGYDLKLLAAVRQAVAIPMTVLGGAGSLQDVASILNSLGTIGVGAGSLFVFKGKYRAVLINYPTPAEKDALIVGALNGKQAGA